MKNLLLATLIGCLLFCSNLAAAQKLTDAPVRYCGSLKPTKEYLAAHPDVKARMEAIEAQTQQYIKNASALASKEAPGTQGPVVIIPVVVHIVYKLPVQNLSDAVVQSQIDILNADFRKLNADVVRTPVPFAPRAADARVNFCLATRDPNGNPTTGITRDYTTRDRFLWSTDDVKFTATGGVNAWNPAQHLNIWVCFLGNGPDDAAGYAYWPAILPSPNVDGVVVNLTTTLLKCEIVASSSC